MVNFLEKLLAVIVAFCFGCYITANYLDKPFVEKQKKEIKKQIQILFNDDINADKFQ